MSVIPPMLGSRIDMPEPAFRFAPASQFRCQGIVDLALREHVQVLGPRLREFRRDPEGDPSAGDLVLVCGAVGELHVGTGVPEQLLLQLGNRRNVGGNSVDVLWRPMVHVALPAEGSGHGGAQELMRLPSGYAAVITCF